MKISIVTVSFNQAEYLEETILSVLNQGYDELEYIIIDGGSEDGSVDIIKKYEKHLTYWESEIDNGQSEAINKGFSKATGEIITWLNSDDLLYPGALMEVKKIFQKYPDIGLIHGGIILFNEKKDLKKIFSYDTPCIERYFGGMNFSQPSAFFKKKYFDEIGFLQEELHYGMDYDIFTRLVCVCSFKPVKKILAKYRLHSTSKTIAANDKFIIDWKKVFINLCKNLNWSEELSFLEKTSFYNDELNYDYPFSFSIDAKKLMKVNRQKVLFYHLCIFCKELYYAKKIEESKKVFQIIYNHFSITYLLMEKGLFFMFLKLYTSSKILNLFKLKQFNKAR